jgi:pSer/pThr/pTyr-binding forkhead associated (FHA) protein
LITPDPLVVPDPLVSASPIVSPALSGGESAPQPSVTHQPPTSQQPPMPPTPMPSIASTRLQQQTVRLLHVQTNTSVELPQNLTVLHIGKPNDRIPPDVDVSGFPDSEIVSRIHADIRVEGDAFYIEDIGSSNGTYINNVPLPIGNRHRLRPGDRIALGKGDKVTFLFQLS